MSVTLRIAGESDLDRVDRMAEAFRAEIGVPQRAEDRRAVLKELLDGSPHGVVYLVGPPSSPVGYLVLAFGYAPLAGGLEARVQELYIRAAVRGRGMGSETLSALAGMLARHNVAALRLDVPPEQEGLARIARRQGFLSRDGTQALALMLAAPR